MGIFYEALAFDGLWILAIGAGLAGIVRGFSGFGTAMVYLPIASHVLPPVWVIITMIVIDMFGPLPAVPRAIRDGHPRDVLRLAIGALIGTPIGILALTSMSPDVFRYAVSLFGLSLLILLVGGVRYRGAVSPSMVYATGGIGGVTGGAVGMAGPPVILLYMARPLPPAVIRANTLLFLILADFMLAGLFAWRGFLELSPIMLGVALIPVYLGAVWVGSTIFDPARETVYRWVAYAIIAASALSGLPTWD